MVQKGGIDDAYPAKRRGTKCSGSPGHSAKRSRGVCAKFADKVWQGLIGEPITKGKVNMNSNVQQSIREMMEFRKEFVKKNLPAPIKSANATIFGGSDGAREIILTPETASRYGIPYNKVTIPDVETAKKLTGIPDVFFDEKIADANKENEFPDWSIRENHTEGNLCKLVAAYIYGDSRKVKEHERLINKTTFPMKIDYYGNANEDYSIPDGSTLTIDGKGKTVSFEANSITFCGKAILRFLNANGCASINYVMGDRDESEGVIEACGGNGGNGTNGSAGGIGAAGKNGAKNNDSAKNGGTGGNGSDGNNGSSGGSAMPISITLDEIKVKTRIFSYGGNGGNGGNGGAGGRGGAGGNGDDSKDCKDGGRGGNGGNGGKGGDGGSGGNGAKVTILYGSGVENIIEKKSSGGNGGVGGNGGAGGAGGTGGSKAGSGTAGASGSQGSGGLPSAGGSGGTGGEIVIQPIT